MERKLPTRKSPRKSRAAEERSGVTATYGERETITSEEADKFISSYDKTTKKLMQAYGLDVKSTPYANEAHKERTAFLYDLLEANYVIKDPNPRLKGTSKDFNISRK
jgi:hypothetical protein